MTLEEKAKKWVKENACEWCINADECEQGCIDCHGIKGYIAGATEVLKMKVNVTTISDAPLERDRQLDKARSIVHRLLVLIQKHKWWDYTVIDEARAFMSEVDRDKNND